MGDCGLGGGGRKIRPSLALETIHFYALILEYYLIIIK